MVSGYFLYLMQSDKWVFRFKFVFFLTHDFAGWIKTRRDQFFVSFIPFVVETGREKKECRLGQ